MFLGSVVLEVAIGLFLIYFLLALITSSVNEWLCSLFALRAKTLREGVSNLLDEPTTAALAARWGKPQLSEAFYANPLIEGLSRNRGGRGPSYIPADTFVRVLLELTAPSDAENTQRSWSEVLKDLRGRLASGELSDVEKELLIQLEKAGVDSAKLVQLETMTSHLTAARSELMDFQLNTEAANSEAGKFLLDRAAAYNNSVTQLEQEVAQTLNQAQVNMEAYFNDAMDRVSGWYKRKVQWMIIGLALLATVMLNVDTLAIINDLMMEPELRAAIVAIAEETVQEGNSSDDQSADNGTGKSLADVDSLAQIGLSLGWKECPPLPKSWREPYKDIVRCEETELSGDSQVGQFWLTKLMGLLITASAVSLGAPFWFDMLNKLVNLRMAGAKK